MRSSRRPPCRLHHPSRLRLRCAASTTAQPACPPAPTRLAVFGVIATSDAVVEALNALPRPAGVPPAAPPVVLSPPPPPRALSQREAAGLVLLAFAAGVALGAARLR